MIDDRDRRIVRQHSQEMAIRWQAVVFKEMGDLPTLDDLKKTIDWFDQDAYSTQAAPASSSKALGDMSDEEIERATGGTVSREERLASEKQQNLISLRAKQKKLTKGKVKEILKKHGKVESLERLPFAAVDSVLEEIGQ